MSDFWPIQWLPRFAHHRRCMVKSNRTRIEIRWVGSPRNNWHNRKYKRIYENSLVSPETAMMKPWQILRCFPLVTIFDISTTHWFRKVSSLSFVDCDYSNKILFTMCSYFGDDNSKIMTLCKTYFTALKRVLLKTSLNITHSNYSEKYM